MSHNSSLNSVVSSNSSSTDVGQGISLKDTLVLVASTTVAIGAGYFLYSRFVNNYKQNDTNNNKSVDDLQMKQNNNNNNTSNPAGESIEETIQRVVQLLYSESNATVAAGLDIVLRLTAVCKFSFLLTSAIELEEQNSLLRFPLDVNS